MFLTSMMHSACRSKQDCDTRVLITIEVSLFVSSSLEAAEEVEEQAGVRHRDS